MRVDPTVSQSPAANGAARSAADSAASAATSSAPRPVVLATRGLTKNFGSLRAVDGLDLEVYKGDVFGFLGPNGAGKTTVIRLILGLIFPTSGYAEILGNRVPGDHRSTARHVGGFVDDPTFYLGMSARRNLRLLGSMSGPVAEERIDEVLAIVGLSERAESKVKGFSHGMKQRLGIAQALLHRPAVIVLDEPTSGLDPRGMKDVRELVRDVSATGTTVFLSSHLLHEVDQVCNRAVIIDRGKVVVQGPVSELRPTGSAVKILTGDQGKAAETLRALFGAGSVKLDEEFLVVNAAEEAVPELVSRLVADGVPVRAIVPAAEQGLEDFFLQLTEPDEDGTRSPAGKRRRFGLGRSKANAPKGGAE